MRICIALAVSLLAFTGCKKKEDAADKATATADDKAAAAVDKAAAKPPEDKAVEGTPIAMDAPALFDDYNKPGQDGLALLEKWRAGTIVTGTVTQVMAEESGKATIWVDAGANHKMSLGFTDDGKAATSKGVKKGDRITAQCQVGGSDGNLMMLIECALK
jgi:hypothetical protein